MRSLGRAEFKTIPSRVVGSNERKKGIDLGRILGCDSNPARDTKPKRLDPTALDLGGNREKANSSVYHCANLWGGDTELSGGGSR